MQWLLDVNLFYDFRFTVNKKTVVWLHFCTRLKKQTNNNLFQSSTYFWIILAFLFSRKPWRLNELNFIRFVNHNFSFSKNKSDNTSMVNIASYRTHIQFMKEKKNLCLVSIRNLKQLIRLNLFKFVLHCLLEEMIAINWITDNGFLS